MVLLLVMAWTTGGYFPAGHLPAGAAAFAALAVFALARPPRWRPSGPTLWGLAALAGLAAWTGLSSRWSAAPHTALEDMQRDLVYLALLGLGVVAAGRGRFSRQLVWGVLGVIAVVVGVGLLSRLFPGLVDDGSAASPFASYRLAYPLSYWNAFGALGAMGIVVGLGLAADPRAHAVARGLAAALVVGLGAAAYLSFSRGAWLALFAGLLVLALVATRRGSLLVTAGIVLPVLSVAVLRLNDLEGLTIEPGAGAGQAAQGRGYWPVLLGLMAVAGVAQTVVASAAATATAVTARRRLARPVMATALIGLVAGGGLGYVLFGGEVEGRATVRAGEAESFLQRQWDEFSRPTEFGGTGSSRLVTAQGTRSDMYRVALDSFGESPIVGQGAGAFEYRFAEQREVQEKVRDAHSLFLETLAELGLVGAGLLLGFLAALVAGLRRARRRRDGLTGAQVAAVAAGCMVWATHAAVDWAWQMPALTGCALILVAAALTGEREAGGVDERPPRPHGTPRRDAGDPSVVAP